MAVSTIPNYVQRDGVGHGAVYNGRITSETLRWYRINSNLYFIWAVFKTVYQMGKDGVIATGFQGSSSGASPLILGTPINLYVNTNGELCLGEAINANVWVTACGMYEVYNPNF